jgi:hypothetical protein
LRCRLCQHQTGSTSVVNAFFEAERITLLRRELVDSAVIAGTGGTHIIRRCARCGSALWSAYPRLGELGLGLRVGPQWIGPSTASPLRRTYSYHSLTVRGDAS